MNEEVTEQSNFQNKDYKTLLGQKSELEKAMSKWPGVRTKSDMYSVGKGFLLTNTVAIHRWLKQEWFVLWILNLCSFL